MAQSTSDITGLNTMSTSPTRTTATADPREAMGKLLGCTVKCTLVDGRIATGRFVCLDRLRNIILCDVLEVRKVPVAAYGSYVDSARQQHGHDSKGKSKEERSNEHEASSKHYVYAARKLSQAMVPGKHLVKVEVSQKIWDSKVLN
mmetsp:Transcript_1902/g.5020  ORF Transcript_1902/g.5020 Transcript_1902/m.5020 type:complete len:146 (-) Transcript_1902:652-1089(-)